MEKRTPPLHRRPTARMHFTYNPLEDHRLAICSFDLWPRNVRIASHRLGAADNHREVDVVRLHRTVRMNLWFRVMGIRMLPLKRTPSTPLWDRP
jgi:hypothetical protein